MTNMHLRHPRKFKTTLASKAEQNFALHADAVNVYGHNEELQEQ